LFTISAQNLVILTSVIVPLVVGFFTKLDASPRVKVVVNLVLTAFMSLIGNALNENGIAVISSQMFSNFVIGLVVSIGTYYGVYKPLEIPTKSAPNKGIG
jgi:hypothetical protein